MTTLESDTLVNSGSLTGSLIDNGGAAVSLAPDALLLNPAPISAIPIRPPVGGGGGGVVLPSIQFVSPQPGQIFASDGLVRISVITSGASRLDFFARDASGSGSVVFLRTFGAVSGGSQTQIDVPASQIPFPSASIQLNLYQGFPSNPTMGNSGVFFIQSQPTESNAQFTSPRGGEVWSCFQVQPVSWTFNGSPQRWEIAYSLNNGPFVTVNNQIPGPDRFYYFFPPFVSFPTQARLRLRKVSATGVIKDTISNVFTLVNS